MDITQGRVLVTGAGGFVGSHLVEELLGLGCQVRAFVRYNSRNSYGHLEELGEQLGDVEIISGDLRDENRVRQAVEGCQTVLHLGALIGIPYSYLSPRDVYDVNAGGTLNVLSACLSHEVEKVIITSTSEVYGTPQYVPIDEKHPLQSQSPYAASKTASDKLGESFYNSYQLPVATLRPFNTFGPRQSARAVIPTIITQALKGDQIKLGNLAPRRDMLFVKDTAKAFIAIAQSDAAIGKVLNVGSGADLSIGDMAEMIQQLMGTDLKIVEENQRKRRKGSEVERLLCDYAKAQELLKWQPEYSLEDGLKLTIDYIKQNIDNYKAGIYNV
jgi:NAD dependent epimerase/dehydratase